MGLIGQEFPRIGDFSVINDVCNKSYESYSAVLSNNQTSKGLDLTGCDCPKRELPPPVPKRLPYPATPENREKIRDWILYYGVRT